MDMDKRILLGVDANYSSVTQYAIQMVGDLFERANPPFTILLIHIIPNMHITAEYSYHLMDQYELAARPIEQRKEAKEILSKASVDLQRQGFSHRNIELITRIGSPAEEIVKLAEERHVNVIVLGSRGNNWHQQVRRIIWGSVSRQVLHLAPCPVIMVLPPRPQTGQKLVTWYEQATKHYLSIHTSSLVVFTPDTVTEMFPPPRKQSIEQNEIEAAKLALEKLAAQGILFRHDIQGQVRYIND